MPTIEDDIARRVSQAVKARRKALGLTLRALAARSGVSASMISDVERGAKSPTVATLALLADALGQPIAKLLQVPTAPAGRIQVFRGAERRTAIDPASGARRDPLGPHQASSKVEFLRYAVPPHRTAGPFAAHPRGTVEHMHLAAGSLRLVCGEETADMQAGDSCLCRADAPHRFDNSEGNVEALIYLVIERA